MLHFGLAFSFDNHEVGHIPRKLCLTHRLRVGHYPHKVSNCLPSIEQLCGLYGGSGSNSRIDDGWNVLWWNFYELLALGTSLANCVTITRLWVVQYPPNVFRRTARILFIKQAFGVVDAVFGDEITVEYFGIWKQMNCFNICIKHMSIDV